MFMTCGQMEAGRRQSLEQGLRAGFPDAQHLPRRLHFRSQQGIGICQFLKGEHRHLHRHIRRRPVEPGSAADIDQAFAQHDPGGNVHHGNTGHLADIGNGSGGPRIDLNDVEFPLMNQVLDIHQSPGAKGQSQFGGTVADYPQHLVREIVRRIDGNGVTAVNTGPFHMLHDAGDQDIPAIRDHIHLKLRSRHVLVDEHRILNGVFKNAGHVRPDSLIRPGNGHVLSADDIRGTQEHRIPQDIGRLQRLLHGQGRQSPGPPDAELLKESIKADAVLGQVDAVCRGAQDLYRALVPPKATTTPSGFSAFRICSTSSPKSGSK